MIQSGTQLVVADNSGAKIIQCISTLHGASVKSARLADVISATVKIATPRAAVKKKEVVNAVIVRTRSAVKRADGSYIRFSENAAVVIDKEGNPRATRIFGPVPRELRDRFGKIISLAPEVV